MNKRQKEVIEHALTSEKHMIRRLKVVYQQSLADINKEIALLKSREQTQSVIYQKQYQEAMKSQIETILKQMANGNFETISEYLETCYEDGFVGTMYDLHGQGIPLIMPINQQLMVEAVATNSKISTTLYKKLGQIIPQLKKRISIEVSRGISSNLSYHEIARNLDGVAKIGYNHALTIAQTEGHRIQIAAQLDANHAAKEKGADIVKQWDSTLDGNTRESHQKADGQLRELDEDFEVGGYRGPAPGHIGVASEDVRCRCSLLQRARSALDEEELSTLKERAEFFGLDKTKDFEDFKNKYLKAVENSAESGIIRSGALNPLTTDRAEYDRAKAHAERYYASVRKMTTDARRISQNTGYEESLIQDIKKFVFLEKHDLGNGQLEYFCPDFMMAQSWQRLIDGKNIQHHDLTLLNHEKMERELINQGYSQQEAHKITEKKYNYHEEAKTYYAEINKHKKK